MGQSWGSPGGPWPNKWLIIQHWCRITQWFGSPQPLGRRARPSCGSWALQDSQVPAVRPSCSPHLDGEALLAQLVQELLPLDLLLAAHLVDVAH